MADRSHWDPDMAAARAAYEAEAARHPPIGLTPPFAPHRAISDAINLVFAQGGPVMAETRPLWIEAHGRRVQCRLHRPTQAALHPCVLWFHGGGWVWSSIDTHDRLARELAAAGEVAVLLVDYTLSPEARFPRALEECVGLVRALATQAASWGIDGARLLVGGDSAGGNLALATALVLRDQGGPALAGLLTAYPVCDSAMNTPSYARFGTDHGMTADDMGFYWDSYVAQPADRAHPWAAPLRAECHSLPPTCMLLAALDVLYDEGAAMATRLAAAGVAVTCHTYPGTIHGFLRMTGQVEAARRAVADAGAWLRGLSR